MSELSPFHLAIPVSNLEQCCAFYEQLLGCSRGRSDLHWCDYNLYGHQLVLHQVARSEPSRSSNPVDGENVPVPHFGVVLSMQDWQELADRLVRADVQFLIQPGVRFRGQVGEQATMFFLDPSGNALEFKAFADINQLFAS